MSKKSEDSLERFFQKAVKQYDAPFMESAWHKMEKMLDDKAMRGAAIRAKRIRQAAIFVVIALLLVPAIYFTGFYNGKRNQAVPSDAKQQTASTSKLPSKEEEQKNQEAKAPSPDQFNDPSIRESTQSLSDKNTNQIVTERVSEDRQLSIEDRPAPPPTHRSSITKISSGSESAQTPGDQHPGGSGQAGREDFNNKEMILSEDDNTTENEEVIPDEPKVVYNDKETGFTVASEPLQMADSTEKKDELLPIDTLATDKKPAEEEEEKLQMLPSRWSIAIAVAPDFSSTALGRYTAPGEAVGLLIRYRVMKRFSLSTGLLRSNKKYQSSGADYSPPTGYWIRKTNGIIPDKIAGSCLVYEMPLMVQYDFAQARKATAFIGVGVSSYRMEHQRYKYSFAQENPGAAAGWSTTKSAAYVFNVGHLSVGYERALTPRVALGLEPYLKIPFKGMGWSKVDLFSTGIFINLRYTISKKVRTE